MPRTATGTVDLEYETFGTRGDPPALLIMGLGMQMVAWDDRFCRQLVDRGFFVVRFDNRDVGRSTWLEALGMPDLGAALAGDPSAAKYTLDDMADDVTMLLDALAMPRVHVVGVSMGGMVGQCLAVRNPARVASLVSIMATTGDRRVGRTDAEVASVVLSPAPVDRDGAIEHAVNLWRAIGSKGFPFDEDAVRARTARAFARGVNPVGIARQMAAITTARDRTADLARLAMPTVVIHGEGDPLIDRSGGEATARAIPGARLVMVPGMGHDMPVELWPTILDAIVDVATRASGPEAYRADAR
jgi:pimeloyl-ACP methyl ester carboxylesterase